MSLNNLGLFKLMTGKMGWLTQRQQVLADNIAQADTPDAMASDLKPFTFRSLFTRGGKLAPAQTSDSHMAGRGSREDFRADPVKKTYETSPDGNTIVLEEQMMRMSQTRMDFDFVTSLYKRNVGLIKAAVGRTSSQ